uniref:Uncharacterized protein n=1 Tax=Romanomermis culicivorax TaxID=13658 RepID=A0A915HPV3_ROMCU
MWSTVQVPTPLISKVCQSLPAARLISPHPSFMSEEISSLENERSIAYLCCGAQKIETKDLITPGNPDKTTANIKNKYHDDKNDISSLIRKFCILHHFTFVKFATKLTESTLKR